MKEPTISDLVKALEMAGIYRCPYSGEFIQAEGDRSQLTVPGSVPCSPGGLLLHLHEGGELSAEDGHRACEWLWGSWRAFLIPWEVETTQHPHLATLRALAASLGFRRPPMYSESYFANFLRSRGFRVA